MKTFPLSSSDAKEIIFLESQRIYHAKDKYYESLKALEETVLTIVALILFGLQMSQQHIDIHQDDESEQATFHWYSDLLNILAALSFFSSVGYKAYVTRNRIYHMRNLLNNYQADKNNHDKKLMVNRYQLLIKIAVRAVFSDVNHADQQGNYFAIMLEPYYLEYFTKEYLKFDSMDKLEEKITTILDPQQHQSWMFDIIWVVPPLVFLSLVVILLVQLGVNLFIPKNAAMITALSFTLVLAVTNLFSHLLDHSTQLPAAQVLNALRSNVQSVEAIEEGAQNSIDKLKEQLGQTEFEQHQVNLERLTEAEVAQMLDRSQNVQLFEVGSLPDLEKAKSTMFGHIGIFFAKNALIRANQNELTQIAPDFIKLKKLLRKKESEIRLLLGNNNKQSLDLLLNMTQNFDEKCKKEHEALQTIFLALTNSKDKNAKVTKELEQFLGNLNKLQLRKVAYNQL